nr:mucin-12-like isoform X4 [Procambarus clarkii]
MGVVWWIVIAAAATACLPAIGVLSEGGPQLTSTHLHHTHLDHPLTPHTHTWSRLHDTTSATTESGSDEKGQTQVPTVEVETVATWSSLVRDETIVSGPNSTWNPTEDLNTLTTSVGDATSTLTVVPDTTDDKEGATVVQESAREDAEKAILLTESKFGAVTDIGGAAPTLSAGDVNTLDNGEDDGEAITTVSDVVTDLHSATDSYVTLSAVLDNDITEVTTVVSASDMVSSSVPSQVVVLMSHEDVDDTMPTVPDSALTVIESVRGVSDVKVTSRVRGGAQAGEGITPMVPTLPQGPVWDIISPADGGTLTVTQEHGERRDVDSVMVTTVMADDVTLVNTVLDHGDGEITVLDDIVTGVEGTDNSSMKEVTVGSAKDGIVSAKDGIVSAKDGIVSAKDGIVSAKDGIVSAKDGTVSSQDEEVEDERETSRPSTGGVNQDEEPLTPEHSVISGDHWVTPDVTLVSPVTLERTTLYPPATPVAQEASHHGPHQVTLTQDGVATYSDPFTGHYAALQDVLQDTNTLKEGTGRPRDGLATSDHLVTRDEAGTGVRHVTSHEHVMADVTSGSVTGDDDYELIMETVISTATVYYDKEPPRQLVGTSHRFPRTVSADLRATPAHLNDLAATDQYRGFPSLYPEDAFSTFMDGDSRLPTDLRKANRKSNPEPDIDDIIKGIVQLLGGNVKVTAADVPNTRLTTFDGVSSTRINNRGPPRLTQLPFGVLSSSVHTQIPIRAPVTPPVNMANLRPLPGKPQFVANTLPPFMASLPPALASRPIPPPALASRPIPPPALASRPIPPLQRPYATGIPLPVDLLPDSQEIYDTSPEITVNPVFQDYGDDTMDGVPSGYTHLPSHPPHSSVPLTHTTTLQHHTHTLTTFTTLSSTTTLSSSEVVSSLTLDASQVSASGADVTSDATGVTDASTSASADVLASAPTDASSSASTEVLTGVTVPSDPTGVTDTSSIQSTSVPDASTSLSTSVPDASTSLSTSVPDASTSLSTSVPDASTSLSTSVPDASTSWMTAAPTQQTSTETELQPSMLESSSTTIRSSWDLQGDPHVPSTTARSTSPSSATPTLWVPTPAPPQPRPGVVMDDPQYRPSPGVVLDDPQYRPGHIITGTVVPYDAGGPGDIFDVTVSAHQGFGLPQSPFLHPVNPNLAHPLPPPAHQGALVTTPAEGVDGFVSIDGRKTYFDLFPAATDTQVLPQQQTAGLGVGVVIPEDDLPLEGDASKQDLGGYYPPAQPLSPRPQPPTPTQPPPRPQPPTHPPRPLRKPYNRRPTQPSIRIDTCIVGDDSTCQEQLGEVCRTEEEVSSCYCRPGTARRRPRTPCRRMISLHVSLKVDRVGDQRIVWSGNYDNPESEEYRLLEWEAKHAISSTMSKTPLGSAYLGNTVHKFYSLGGKVIVNSTINLEDLPSTRNRNLRHALQRQMLQVIQSHANNIGESALWVDGPLNPIPDVSDVNECNEESLHDCHPDATCINEFGTFTCHCLPGYTDRFSDDPEQVGRRCESCSSDYCNKKGECSIHGGHKVCQCRGSYYGTRCEIDGEVLGVAVGASVAAVVIIILTLIFLCMWSRRWKAEDRKTEVLARGGGMGTFAVNVQHKGASAGHQYGATLDDRMRWAHLADTLSNQNIYAQQQQQYGGGGVYTASSSDYLTSSGASNTPFSIYNRVTRALSNSTLGRQQVGWLGRVRRALGGSRAAMTRRSAHTPPTQPTLTLQQLMALHAQLSPQPEQLRGGVGSTCAAPTITPTPTNLYQHQRQVAGSSSGYASLGTLGSTSSPQYGHQYPPPQQFGLQHLSAVSHLASMQQQQQQPQQYLKQSAFNSQSTYGQFGPASFNTMSQGGVSRAPTLGARTPVPLHDVAGAATIGPMGGGTVAPSGMGLESSEDDAERPYHLPRPKSRVSLGDTSDIYYEPDDLTSTLGLPDRPPPPLPKSSHPQTYNFPFLH